MEYNNISLSMAVVPQTWLDTLLNKLESVESLLQKKSEEEVSPQIRN